MARNWSTLGLAWNIVGMIFLLLAEALAAPDFPVRYSQLYGCALNNLNRVREEIVRVTKDTPPFLVAGLKERELTFANSVILHEHYFGNLGGDGRLDGAIEKALSHAYGSVADGRNSSV